MGTKSHCSLLAYISLYMKGAATQLFKRQMKNRNFFSKLSNFYFDLRPLGQTPGQDRGAKTQPQGQLECANPRGSPGGMVRLRID